jgi:hypothetical protein
MSGNGVAVIAATAAMTMSGDDEEQQPGQQWSETRWQRRQRVAIMATRTTRRGGELTSGYTGKTGREKESENAAFAGGYTSKVAVLKREAQGRTVALNA